jgi:hypothetical protein
MTNHTWIAFHLYYAEDRDRLLREAIRPLMASLMASGAIDRFFFVRFGLGGDHVRLRLRVVPRHEAAVRDAVTQAAAVFFARWPSTRRVTDDEIRARNQLVLASDPGEADDGIYPDNSLRQCEFRPETQRYGGAALLGHSLDFFAVSSVHALHFLAEHGDKPRARQLPMILRLLFSQAWGLAWDEDSLLAILAYAETYWGDPIRPLLDRGDRLFAERPALYCQMLHREREELLASRPSGTTLPSLAEAGARLTSALRAAEPATRQSIAMSQLHMTANRLGLGNAEECYLGRLLRRAVEAMLQDVPWCPPGSSSELARLPENDLPALLSRTFATLAMPAG